LVSPRDDLFADLCYLWQLRDGFKVTVMFENQVNDCLFLARREAAESDEVKSQLVEEGSTKVTRSEEPENADGILSLPAEEPMGGFEDHSLDDVVRG